MNVVIVSTFRDATGYLDLYFAQVDALVKRLRERGDTPMLILGYGDCTDGTEAALFDAVIQNYGALLIDVSHGGRAFGSVEHPERFRQLAYVGNRLWQAIPDDADVVVLVESDLLWDARTLLTLIDHTATYPAIAPMIFDVAPPDRFRDVFAFRRNGVRFTNEPPYHPDLATVAPGELLQVDSAGSVLAMRGEWARRVRFPQEDVIVGLCRGLYESGGSVWLDPGLCVRHP